MAATRRLSELVASALSRLNLPPGRPTVALSGGADSAALAHLAAEAGAEPLLLHVHHGFHASDVLAAAAGRIAAQLGLPLEVIAVDVAEGPSLEAMARAARYGVFDQIDQPVLTGHTRDDSVETMMINLIRGTGIDGLSGIPYHRPPNVYRPILAISRSETREIAALAGLEFYDDPMNETLDLARNRVRHVILPRMRELNPRLDEAMTRTSATLSADAGFLDAAAGALPPAELAVGVLITLPSPLGDRLVRRWLESHDVEVSAEIVARVWSVVSGGTPTQDLEGGRRVTRDRAVIRIE